MASDPTEFVNLFIRHERRLYAYLLTVLGNATHAEEVLQQTSLVLWAKFAEFRPGSDFAAWAIQVAYLTARNHRRAQARSRVQFSQAMFEAAAERAAARIEEVDALHDALADCLDGLAKEDRDVIRRRYELGASVQTIAQQVGQSIHAVYRSLARIHAALLRCVTGKLAAGE